MLLGGPKRHQTGFAMSQVVRKQLARKIWEQRGWATVAVHFTERDKAGEWKDAKVALLRFKKEHEAWKKQATITLSLDDAHALAAVLASWT